MKPKFTLGRVECFDWDTRWGFAAIEGTGVMVFIHWFDVRKPMFYCGKIYYAKDPHDTIPLPVHGSYILMEVVPGEKGPRASMWGMWEEFGRAMIREWVKTHDLCAVCRHPIAGHGLDDYCPDCGNLCGHRFIEPIGFDEDDPSFVEITLSDGRKGVQMIDYHETNLGDSPGGFTICE